MSSPAENDNSPNKTDEELFIAYASEGNQTAFEVLYQRHQEDFVSFIYNRYIRDKEIAEDVAQQAFLSLHIKKDKYNPNKPFAKWLYWLAGNYAINYARDGHRQIRYSGTATFSLHDHGSRDSEHKTLRNEPANRPDGLSILDDQDETIETSREKVYEAITTLPTLNKKVLSLVYYENKSERNAAEELGITRHELRRILADSMAMLKEHLFSDPAVA